MANEMVNPPQIIQQTAAYIEAEFQGDSSGHDWWHIYRVWKNAIRIARREGGDLLIVELAALLHDLDDWKLSPSPDGTPLRAAAWLSQLGEASCKLQVCRL